MEELHVIVSGRVQMVMFRDFVTRKARALGIRGWVRNLNDGTVEFVAQGERPDLERLLAKVHRGPLLARVDGVQPEFRSATETLGRFEIRY
jgi:acylphosphatase